MIHNLIYNLIVEVIELFWQSMIRNLNLKVESCLNTG